jgi:phage-related tail fiber protein
MAYKSIHTTIGLAALVAAEVNDTPVGLIEMAVGDGNGNPVTDDLVVPGQTTLIREVYRDTINTLYQDPDDSTLFYAELVIPNTEGGFTLREVGVFDADGAMHIFGNLPDTYKPEDTEGAFADTIVRVAFKVSNAAEITLITDTNIVMASRAWVENNIDACAIMPGGTTGQILTKASNACGDVEWSNPDAVEVVVDTIVEKQTLSALQVNVDWATVTTNGLAVYIEGVRIWEGAGAGEWQKGTIPLDETRSVLGQSYPAGTEIVGVQNDPAGSVVDALLRDNNLSDLTNTTTARTNLGVYSKAETDARAKQPGDIFYTARSTAPSRSLKANGAAVSRTAYADLFAAIGTTYGAGDGFSTFNLPEGRGEFIRGLDDGRGVDIARTLGSWQADMFQSHSHPLPYNDDNHSAGTLSDTGEGTVMSASQTGLTGGTETRPRNIAFLCCIQY